MIPPLPVKPIVIVIGLVLALFVCLIVGKRGCLSALIILVFLFLLIYFIVTGQVSVW
jgi:hypothetical protein